MARINDTQQMFRFSGDLDFIPTRQTKNSAGYDVRATESVSMSAGECFKIGLGIKLTEAPMDMYLELHPRSSLRYKAGCEGIGVIDSDYRDEIMMILYPKNDYTIIKGQRIGQLIPKKSYSSVMDCPTKSESRQGGIGSTKEV